MTPEIKNEMEVTEFLAAVIQKSAKLMSEGKMDCFDVKFELDGKRYQLSLLEDKEFGYIKEN
jgi:hypothetical protein